MAGSARHTSRVTSGDGPSSGFPRSCSGRPAPLVILAGKEYGSGSSRDWA
ncbi:hypothetical protein, partial [Streptomyces prunicolor]